MASRTFLFLALFASTVSVILSTPQLHPPFVHSAPKEDAVLAVEPDSARPDSPNEPDNIQLPNINLRTFGDLFNLSAYLAGAPTNSAALNFIPLITLLTAKG